MSKFNLAFYTVGLAVSCENCQKTATIQEEGEIPPGWWVLIDSSKTGGLFCQVSCSYHYISKIMSDEKDDPIYHRKGTFN